MKDIDIINTFVKIFLISFYIYVIYEKITSYKSKKVNYIIKFITSTITSIMYIIICQYIPPLITIILVYAVNGIMINTLIKDYFNGMAYIYSCIISYIIYLFAIIITAILLFIITPRREFTDLITLLSILLITNSLFLLIFKLKRIKNGLNFLKVKTISKSLKISTMFLSGLVILIFGILQKNINWIMGIYVLIGSICIMISLTIWIKSQITKTYKNKMRDRTIEMQKAEIDEKEKIIEEIKAENLKFANTIHKYNHKFESLEFAIKKVLELDNKTEFANEIAVILEESKNTAKNFAKETEVDTRKIPLTNINGIDTMFKYMQEEAIKNNIQFDLKINANINSLINEIIPKEKFETLIGDHIKDAIIAINSNNKTYKSILVTLGLVDGIYEFSVYDTGIEFKIDTLLKLGIEQVTTHKEEGGSGIGFMTTFKTLKECKASLVIEEYNPETTNYTKAITIRFDGKNEYKIYSYRAEKIKEQKGKRRIIIKRIK